MSATTIVMGGPPPVIGPRVDRRGRPGSSVGATLHGHGVGPTRLPRLRIPRGEARLGHEAGGGSVLLVALERVVAVRAEAGSHDAEPPQRLVDCPVASLSTVEGALRQRPLALPRCLLTWKRSLHTVLDSHRVKDEPPETVRFRDACAGRGKLSGSPTSRRLGTRVSNQRPTASPVTWLWDARGWGTSFGYARVSTPDQHPALQVDALTATGCYRVFIETASGARADRPVLAQVLDQLRPGDTLVVWKLDRLGRSLRHLLDTVTGLADRGIGFRSLQEALDTTTPGGRLVFHVFAALAEFERDLIRERTSRAGRRRARGRNGGRPPRSWTPARSSWPASCTPAAATPRPRSPAGSRSAAAPSTATSHPRGEHVHARIPPDRDPGVLTALVAGRVAVTRTGRLRRTIQANVELGSLPADHPSRRTSRATSRTWSTRLSARARAVRPHEVDQGVDRFWATTAAFGLFGAALMVMDPLPRTVRLGALSGFAVTVLTSVGFAVAGVLRWRQERDLDDDEESDPDDDQADDDQTRLLTASRSERHP